MSNIEIKNVSKSFNHINALKDINLTLEENRIYGLLGRNGAGKTTLLNLINNRLFQDEGEITLSGESVTERASIQEQFIYIGENSLYPDAMKVNKLFKLAADFYNNFDYDYAMNLCEKFKVPLKKKIKNLSTGYRTIVKNIFALSSRVPFIFLDEPVLGLDANHRDLFYKELIANYIEHPSTYVISTHLIEEVANIIEDVIIIKDGEVIRNQSKESLVHAGYSVTGSAALVDSYSSDKEVVGIDTLGGIKCAYIIGTQNAVPDELEVSALDLQKLFIQLTNA